MNKSFQNYGLVALVIGVITFTFIFNLSIYIMWLMAVSTATFVLYGLDKWDATRRGRARVPKKLLHLLALLGGFLGAWLGMFVFWHKVRQPPFWVILIISTVLHGLLWLFIIP